MQGLLTAGWLTATSTCCRFSTSSSGERHSCICARTSSCSQTVSELFPLGVLGMNDTVYPPERKTYKLPENTMAEAGPSNWACVGLILAEGDVKTLGALCLLSLSGLPLSLHCPPHRGPCVTSSANDLPSLYMSQQPCTNRFSVPPTFSLASTVGMDASNPLMLWLPILFLPLPLVISL